MARTSLPVVVGRVGPAERAAIDPVGATSTSSRRAIPATWTVDPWGADVRDGRLYGRGACDMKGGVAAILAAVRALGSEGALHRLGGELMVVARAVRGGRRPGHARRDPRRGRPADMAIITEPSNLDVVVAHAGAITFRLTVPGRAAHASQRREGVSALDKLFVLTRALEADETRRNAAETDPLMTALGLPYPTIIGIVDGGEWASTVLDRVVADGRYGVRLGQTPADAEAELRAAIAAACAADDVPARPPGDGRDHRRPVRVGARPVGPPAAGRPRRSRRASDGPPAGAPRRALRRRHADVREPRRHAVRDLRPRRRPGRPQRRRVRAARRGRDVRPGAGGRG